MQNTWMTLKQFAEAHKWPTEDALRAYYFNRQTNGFGYAFIKLKRRLLVNPKRFFDLVEELGKRD